MSILQFLRKKNRYSEQQVTADVGIARATLRLCEKDLRKVKISILEKVAELFNYHIFIAPVPQSIAKSDYSTVAVSLAVINDGFDSWKIHFFNLVDEFRRSPDIRLVMLPPVSGLDTKLQALLASIVETLCHEVDYEAPDWVKKTYFLSKPWFLSGMESLKASAIVESPLEFRRHNVYVDSNILSRA